MKVQIQSFSNDSDGIVNNFLASIPAENVIDVKVNSCDEYGSLITVVYKTEVQNG